jgi:hypothetical protein
MNYKVGKRFVYHAGGNNFRDAGVLSMFMIDKGKNSKVSFVLKSFGGQSPFDYYRRNN